MKTLFLMLMISIVLNVFSQSESQNLLKYWQYRDRLKYFVIPGTNQGESEIIDIRNNMAVYPPPNDPFYKFSSIGQHGVYFGYYLGMLATEYKLLHNNGQFADEANTLEELDLALNQFRVYMDANAELYWNESSSENGFFVRDNMPCEFLNNNSSLGFTTNGESHLSLFNKGLTTNNKWDDINETFKDLPRGHPGYSDFIAARICWGDNAKKEAMSKDEAIGVLMGLALVYKYCPISESSTSQDIACNIITYIRNKYFEHGILPWQIYQPDQTTPGGGGSNCLPFAYAFEEAASFFNCDNIHNDVTWELEESWTLEQYIRMVNTYDNVMPATLAAIGNSWYTGITINLGCCWNWCPNWVPPCVHIPIHFNSTGSGINHVVGQYNNETFYLLLYDILHDKTTNYLSQEKAAVQINSAPCYGPYNYYSNDPNIYTIHPENDDYGGWSASYRWRDDVSEQTGYNYNRGNFNGLDYMMFYNMYHIYYNLSGYINYNNRNLTGIENQPSNWIAINTLTSNQTITNLQPVTEYKAGELINLKPGFHAINNSNFHAFIDDISCDYVNLNKSSLANNKINEENQCKIDSLPAYPCGYDTVHFTSQVRDTLNVLSYNWIFENGYPNQSSLKNPSIYFPNEGNYNISYQITSRSSDYQSELFCFSIYKPACIDSSDSSFNKKFTNKDINKPEQNFHIYPNPTTGIININSQNEDVFYFTEITNLLNQKIKKLNNLIGSIQIDLSYYEKGIYFVNLYSSNGIYKTEKIILK